MGWFGDSNMDAMKFRLERLERKVEALLAHLDVKLPEEDGDEYRRLISAEGKLHAIKLYRERTGAGLSEAKRAIDEIERSSRKAK